MRTPERRTLTGCRWRMSEPRTARTRLRLVLGMPTRKTDFQICELTMPSWSPRRFAIFPQRSFAYGSGCSHPASRGCSHLDKRLRGSPLPAFLVELLRLVDDDLAVGDVDEDLGPLQRPRSRPLEVDSGLVVAAAVARAL